MNKMAAPTRRGQNAPVANDGLRELGQPLTSRAIVRIQLFGPMQATTCFGDDILPRGKRTRAILAYLCLAAGAPVSRARLAGLLWDRMSDASARTNLREALSQLSSVFGAFARELIVVRPDVVWLNVERCWIDVVALMALDSSTLASKPVDFEALCRGKLFEDLDGVSTGFDQWLLSERASVSARLQALSKSVPASVRSRIDASQRAPLPRSLLPATSARARLRVGVPPLVADSLDREQTLAVSLSQQITAALARSRWFDVIAEILPGCAPSNCVVNEHRIRQMNLDYLVDWTVTGQGRDTHINILLLDLAQHAQPVWSESFDLTHGDLHRLSELVTSQIVGRIDPIIPLIEGQPRRQKHYGATGLLLAAKPLMFSMEREKYEQAGRLIGQALEAAPENSAAAAWAAHWHLFYVGQGWADDISRTFAITKKYAVTAIERDSQDAEALAIYGHVCSIVDKDFDSARRYFDRSLRLNPSLAIVWAFSALTYCYAGDPDSALPRLDRYRELAPFDAYFSPYDNAFAIAHTFKGDYERAALVGRRVVDGSPDYVAAYKPLIASLGHLGRREEARPYVAQLLRLEPKFTVENFAEVYPIKKTSDRKRYMEGLRLAGIPER